MKNSLVAIEVKINEIIGYFPLMLQPHPSPDWEAAQPKLEETGIGATQRLTQHIPTGFGPTQRVHSERTCLRFFCRNACVSYHTSLERAGRELLIAFLIFEKG